VFRSNDKNFHWDGSRDIQVMENNVYEYVIHLTLTTGRQLDFEGAIVVL